MAGGRRTGHRRLLGDAGDKRPYLGPTTPGFIQTPYTSEAMRLALIENTPDGKRRDTILLWLQDALAGIEHARVPECSPG